MAMDSAKQQQTLGRNRRNNEIGACQYGNFINYYQFNSAENRIDLLPSCETLFTNSCDDNYIVLDVGCNCGNLTQMLYTHLVKYTGKNVHILGIDIDQILIERSNNHNQHPNNVTYKCSNFMEFEESNEVFREFLNHFNRTTFDAVFSLSITMWIHLNHGDYGLSVFLKRVRDVADLLIIEPQPWKCYLTALRRMRKCGKNFEKFRDLKVRNNVENWIQETLLKECTFTLTFETTPTKWNRKISFYRRIN